MVGFQHRDAAALADKFNAPISGRLVGDGRRLFMGEKIADFLNRARDRVLVPTLEIALNVQ